jgi:hypothetical protein
MSAIKLSTPSSGSISLSPAVTASNLTITVPAVTGTMLTTASTGTVLQVKNQTYASNVSTGSATYVDSGITSSITPSSSSNQVLIQFHINGITSTTGSAANARFALTDGSNTILQIVFDTWVPVGTGGDVVSISGSFLHSPATTSSTTYKIRYLNSSGAGTQINAYWTGGGVTVSGITLMEISA